MKSTAMKKLSGAIVATALLSMGLVSMAPAGQSGDLSSFSCKDLMRYDTPDRDIAISFIHGYLLGKKGTPQYAADALGKATDAFIEHCLDNPKDNALKVMAKFVE